MADCDQIHARVNALRDFSIVHDRIIDKSTDYFTDKSPVNHRVDRCERIAREIERLFEIPENVNDDDR